MKLRICIAWFEITLKINGRLGCLLGVSKDGVAWRGISVCKDGYLLRWCEVEDEEL